MMGLSYRSASSSPVSSSSSQRISENVADASSPRLSTYTKPIIPTEKRLSHHTSNVSEIPKSQEQLKKEIALLEYEILQLERYLLSLYRTVHEEQVPRVPNLTETTLHCTSSNSPSVSAGNRFCNNLEKSDRTDGFQYRYEASPVYQNPVSYPRSFHASLKALSAREEIRPSSSKFSLGDLLGASSRIVENVINPNKVSEDIIRCISFVYCMLSNSARSDSSFSASPPSSLSSSSTFSSKTFHDNNNLHCNKNNIMDRPFEGNSHEANASHFVVIEALKLHLDDDNFNYAALMLQNFRLLVQNLEKVDPNRMRREEKLAFWINIHNALMMHAFLAYGSHNRTRNTLVLKAAYDVGGHRVNPYTIQSSILGIRPHYSSPFLQTLFSPSRKPKACSIRHIYALEYPEPLVHFALSSGVSTDPPVRIYTAETIFEDLRQAKEEFIRNNVSSHKETKILLPKIINYYIKDMSLDMSGFFKETSRCLPETAKRISQKCFKEKMIKCVEWLPENSNFRYVVAGELAGARIKT